MSPITSITITDPALLAQLAATTGPVVFRGPNGECVRMGALAAAGEPPPGFKSPISDEEFEEARKRPDSGITLAEFWRQVERGEWR